MPNSAITRIATTASSPLPRAFNTRMTFSPFRSRRLYSTIAAANTAAPGGDRTMAMDEIVAAITAQADKLKELNHTVLFDLGDDGKVLLDATGGEVKVTPNPDSD